MKHNASKYHINTWTTRIFLCLWVVKAAVYCGNNTLDPTSTGPLLFLHSSTNSPADACVYWQLNSIETARIIFQVSTSNCQLSSIYRNFILQAHWVARTPPWLRVRIRSEQQYSAPVGPGKKSNAHGCMRVWERTESNTSSFYSENLQNIYPQCCIKRL